MSFVSDRIPSGTFRLLGSVIVFAITVLGAATVASAAPGPTDLALTKTDGPDPIVQGETLTYTLKVDNLGAGGTSDATDVTVTDTLSSQVEFKSASSPNGTCQRAGSTVTCDFGTVNAGASATAIITVKASKSGTISNTASVATTVIDGVAANNLDTEMTVVTKKAKTPKTKKPKGKSCARPTITGTRGNDSIIGTKRADVIVTGAGKDRVFARGGKDLVCANGGADLISGGAKDDILIGGGGRDRLFGNKGNDILRGKKGRDRLRGNAGDDILIGGGGRDRLFGNNGNDILRGKKGRDRLLGNAGDDFLNGGGARDKCRGGAGADVLKRCP
jgi:uncharacterized repeat protein (TIGR01451 family)